MVKSFTYMHLKQQNTLNTLKIQDTKHTLNFFVLSILFLLLIDSVTKRLGTS